MSVGRSKSQKSEPSLLEPTQGLEVYITGIDHVRPGTYRFQWILTGLFLKLKWSKGYTIQAAQRLN